MKFSMKFSIRDLLWLTAIMALTVGWWVDHRRTASDEREQWQLRARILQTMFEDEGYTVNVEGTWPYRTLIVKRYNVEMECTLYSLSNPYSRRELESPESPTSTAPAQNPPKK